MSSAGLIQSMAANIQPHESMNAVGPLTELHHHILNTPLSPVVDHEITLNINSLHPEHGPKDYHEHRKLQ